LKVVDTGLSPVGAEMRDLATAALGRRYRTLTERAKRRHLTDKERAELRGLEGALGALQGMEGARADS
jgi:hypothetical protein